MLLGVAGGFVLCQVREIIPKLMLVLVRNCIMPAVLRELMAKL